MTSPSTKTLIFFLFLTGLMLSGGESFGQAKIAPVALYLDDNDRTGRIVIRNDSEQRLEVNVDLLFGYPATDSEGELYLKLFDEIPDNEPSAVSWVRAYPRHTILPVGEQQTIRFAARPPAQLSSGEYWVRPAVSVRKTQENTLENSRGQRYEANINIVQRTILSLNYRHGSVKTGVEINDVSGFYENDTLFVDAEMQRKGNAAYLGHVDIQLFDESDNRLRHNRQEIAVYHSQNRRFEIVAEGLESGTYRVRLSLDTGERYADNNEVLDAQAVEQNIHVKVK